MVGSIYFLQPNVTYKNCDHVMNKGMMIQFSKFSSSLCARILSETEVFLQVPSLLLLLWYNNNNNNNHHHHRINIFITI